MRIREVEDRDQNTYLKIFTSVQSKQYQEWLTKMSSKDIKCTLCQKEVKSYKENLRGDRRTRK